MTYNFNFYDYYRHLYNQQEIHIDDDVVHEDLSLHNIEDMGVVIPSLPDIGNKSFLEWIKHSTSYEESNQIVYYNFYSRYIDSDLGIYYCDDQLDDIQKGIDNHSNNVDIHIEEQNYKLDKDDKIVVQLNNIDNSIIDEINSVKDIYLSNSNKLSLIDGHNFDEQFSYLYSNIDDFQDEVSYINNEHINDLRNIDNRININEDKMNRLQNKIYSYPKHEIMTKDKYQHLPSYDPSIIYFTKET